MKIPDSEVKGSLSARLRRIEGQLRGIEAMVENERECQEIFQQLSAVRSAVQGATLYFLEEYASRCLLNADEQVEPHERAQMVRELMRMLGKAG